MKIAVFGLGYVGTTSAACLLHAGHSIVGVDISPEKAALVAGGRTPVSEPKVEELLAAGHAAGRLNAVSDSTDAALNDVDAVLVSVGTPSRATGQHDMAQLLSVTDDLAQLISRRPEGQTLLCIYRSTMVPGSMEGEVIPRLESATGRPVGEGYEVAINPEFLREGTAVDDYFNPPKIVIGEREPGATSNLAGLYDGIDAPIFRVTFGVAEMAKLVDNSFHALKVAFGNEIGRVARQNGIPVNELMGPFLADTKLNISPSYLRPGGAFGGSCLPKDVRALVAHARDSGLSTPLLESLMASNDSHKTYLSRLVESRVRRGAHIFLGGLSFKPTTDDMRESPLIELAETLVGKGYRLTIFDPDLENREFVGQNLEYVKNHLPHLRQLMVKDPQEARDVDLVVVGKSLPADVQLPDGDRLDISRL